MKIYLQNFEAMPWESWYSELWKASQSNPDIELLSNPKYADYIIDVEKLPIAGRCTNVQPHLWYDGTINKNGSFTITTNGEKHGKELGEMIRSYFSVCLKDDPENDGLICMEDVNIFSHTELPFETFNNVFFQGLQPNPKMHRMIKQSKVFMSPNRDFPRVAIDAAFLGTPILIPASTKNYLMLSSKCGMCFYKDETDLAEKIRYFSDIDVESSEYKTLVEECFKSVHPLWSPSNSLVVIKNEVEKYGERRIGKD